MEELSAAVALPFQIGNLLCDAPMDITCFKLISDTAGLLAEPMTAAAPLEQGEVVATEDQRRLLPMEELSVAVALPFQIGNLLCDAPMDITCFKLITDTAGLLAVPLTAAVPSEQDVVVAIEKGDEDKLKVQAIPCRDEEDITAGLLAGTLAVLAVSEQAEAIQVEERTNWDDIEVRTVSRSDGDVSVSIGPELSIVSSGSIISDTNSITSATDDFLNVDPSYESAGTPISADASKGVEILAENALPESDANGQTLSLVYSEIIMSKSLDVGVLPESQNSGSCIVGKSVFLMDYVPLWGCISIRGKRPEMEDAFATVPHFYKIPLWMLIGNQVLDGLDPSLICMPAHFFGVYDGHGGAQVANYCHECLHHVLVEKLRNSHRGLGGTISDDRKQLWERAFVDCFQKVDDEVGGKASIGGTENTPDAFSQGDHASLDTTSEPVSLETVGSAAVVAVICSSHIIIANCGDSRAVLCRGKQPMPLSVDHKPNREDEYARIEAEGGKIIQWNGYRVFGVLAMSRSIGDRYLKPWIIPVPEVTIVPVTREDECLILASDGLWDVMSNEEVCDVARRRILMWHKKNGVTASTADRSEGADPAAQAAADYLSKLALQKGSKDNITVIVVDLKAKRKFKTKA